MNESGKKIYVLAAPLNLGKTTTALLLDTYFKSKGLKVACLQTIKGQSRECSVSINLYVECYAYFPPAPIKILEGFEKDSCSCSIED